MTGADGGRVAAFFDVDHTLIDVNSGAKWLGYMWRSGQVTLREVPYDHETAAQRAERNGRGDWADALRTGRVGRTEADVRRTSRAAPR